MKDKDAGTVQKLQALEASKAKSKARRDSLIARFKRSMETHAKSSYEASNGGVYVEPYKPANYSELRAREAQSPNMREVIGSFFQVRAASRLTQEQSAVRLDPMEKYWAYYAVRSMRAMRLAQGIEHEDDSDASSGLPTTQSES
jgi:hypothetical protein